MAEGGNREVDIRRISIGRIAAVGAVMGLVLGFVSATSLMTLIAASGADPSTVEFNAGLISTTHRWPMNPVLAYGWPIIASAGNALVAVLLALLYNAIAQYVPLRITIADRTGS